MGKIDSLRNQLIRRFETLLELSSVWKDTEQDREQSVLTTR